MTKDAYFKSTSTFIESNLSLRKPQRVAHKKLKESFQNDYYTHKIIVLPTGTGKTGLIGIAPFEISNGKVLVITPSLIIREGISDDFDTRTQFNFWTERNVIIDDEKLPNVYRYAGYSTNGDKKRVISYMNNADIVIANIHKVYSSNSKKALVNILDDDFFDMIIIDEAHHSAADSWLKTLEHFKAKKILKLTATPFRSDEKALKGDIIYNYSMADAINNGYIKNVFAEDYTNEKLSFIVDGNQIDKEKALEIMDKTWVTRTVAYSRECSNTIVEMSIKALEEKRRMGKAHHQIIAVACSIEHAEQIKELYEEAGYTADYVTSDRPDESEKAIINYKKGQLDVLVNVNMLGEGFDHPNISIAAIFRPFRTLPPYAQFIGRALRKIPGDGVIDEIDNIAHVIYHKELDLEDLWDYYTGQQKKASIRRIIGREVEDGYFQSRDIGEVSTTGEIIRTTRDFLGDGSDLKYSESLKKILQDRERLLEEETNKMKQAGISDESIEEYKKLQKRKLEGEINTKREALREELIREEVRVAHHEHITNIIVQLFESSPIELGGNELPEKSTSNIYKSANTNEAYVIKYINFNLKQKLKRGIDEWETYDFEEARKLLPSMTKKLEDKIKGAETK
ncbi:DEAD/DEAH box helicase [Bacillus capparidis]|uniref:Superfamily II DNA or RNA helicase n=1 Tax=Bacillus capparidis TaxID=1840411 RepID=A0ABS4D1L1_9BACI|nr:DEAD/DEAH box helicase family protein [Bacillus capparidis]MBP1083521.1 superfamily II DNA or RNA helicase [Bacillus capparidis]MED1094719.1 DEAD/DEAH box helicase family protein [Bacillus capparidis]